MMKRQLLILRHGKSDWSRPVDDFHRPLKKRGRKNAARMGAWLVDQGLVPDYVVSSPAVRAVETARLVCSVMKFPVDNIREKAAIYEADEPQLLQVIRATPETVRCGLFIGHNTGMEDLILYLGAGAVQWPDDGKLMPTAALARFRVTTSWSTLGVDTAKLLQIQRPRLLKVG
jgi:phosphohistidine phosphatase